MFLYVRQMTECPVANITAEIFFSCMPPHVSLQIVELIVTGAAMFTGILLLNALVSLHRFVVLHVTLEVAGDVFEANRTLYAHFVERQLPFLSGMDFGVSL